MEKFGEKIYNLRKEKGVSQERLAQELSVARFTVSRWETNAVQPTTENIKSLCAFFGVESTYFLEEVKETAAVKAEQTEQTAVSATENKKPDLRTLKTVCIVVGVVLLVFLAIVCGIAAYISISPGAGGEWGEDIHIVNYEGIIYLVVTAVAVAVLITLSVLLFFKIKKTKNNKQ